MNTYKVELAAPAEAAYEIIRSRAAGAKQGPKFELLKSLDRILDHVVTLHAGTELCGQLGLGALKGIYWASKDSLHVFYRVSTKPLTVVVVFISDVLPSEADTVDQISMELISSGRVKVLPRGIARGAAN